MTSTQATTILSGARSQMVAPPNGASAVLLCMVSVSANAFDGGEWSGAGQRRIHDRQGRVDLGELDVGDAQVFAEVASRNGHRARRLGFAGLCLREGGRPRRVEGHIALHFCMI